MQIAFHTIPVNMNTASMQLKAATGSQTAVHAVQFRWVWVWAFPADKAMQEQVFSQKSAVSRASAYVNIYENVLSCRFMTPAELLALLTKGLAIDKEETNLRFIISVCTEHSVVLRTAQHFHPNWKPRYGMA
jgi:aminopeptidase N